MPFMKSQNVQGLKQALKETYSALEPAEREVVFDVVLFVSAVKGKLSAKDYDICMVFKHRTVKNLEGTLGRFRSIEGVHITHVSREDLFSEPLWLTLIAESESVLKEKPVAERLGPYCAMIFSYDLKALTPQKKMRFYNAVLGRVTS